MMAVFLSSLPVLSVLFVLQILASTSCPNTVGVKKGTNYTITCEAGGNIDDFYWYKGKPSDQDLVGKLENGIKSISQRYKDDYDISGSGALVILNAGIMHESLYNLVTFYTNGTPEEQKVIVNITVSPDPPCPLINDCTTCKCDQLQSNNSGTLVCKVKGSRPWVTLRWNTTSQAGITFVKYPPKVKQNKASADLWDSAVVLDYEITNSCEVTTVLHCVAEDALHILRSKVSTIEIIKDPCKAVTSANVPLDETSPSKTFFVVLGTGLLLVLVFLVFYFTRKRLRKESIDKQLVWSLKDRYQKFCYLRPLAWIEGIHIEDFYIESQCAVTDKKGTSYMSTKELRTDRDILTERWVIFKAEHGYGRTTFLKLVVQEWIKRKKSTYLLIYIPLKQKSREETISDIVIGEMPEASGFTAKDIEAILKTKKCLVILDGLEDLEELRTLSNERNEGQSDQTDDGGSDPRTSLYEGEGNISKGDVQSAHQMTIGELLEWKGNRDYRNLHVWVSSREAECDNLVYPNDNVEVKMTGFSEEQFWKYVHRCCHFYFNLESDISVKLPFSRQVSKHSITKKSRTQGGIKAIDECNKACCCVEQFLKENNVRKTFEETPLLVNMIVHILAASYTSAISYLEGKSITNMTTLIRVVIDGMEARYREKNSLPDETDFTILESKLGRLAARHKDRLVVMNRASWVEKIGADNVNAAEEIGLLKLSRNTSYAEEKKDMEFYHQRIQEYLAEHARC